MRPRRPPHIGRNLRLLACDSAKSVPALAAGELHGARPWTWLAFLWVVVDERDLSAHMNELTYVHNFLLIFSAHVNGSFLS